MADVPHPRKSPGEIPSDGNSVVGTIRINPRNYTDAFVDDPDGGFDILIEGVNDRKNALEGDLVRVQIHEPEKWNLNLVAISNRWDDVEPHLAPLLDNIRSKNKFKQTIQAANNQNCDSQPAATSSSTRNKRSLDDQPADQKKTLDQKTRQLPTNLPSELLSLNAVDIIDLPITQSCIRRTAAVVEIIRRNHSGLAGGFLKAHNQTHALFSPLDSRIPRMLIDLIECPIDLTTAAKRYQNVLFVARLLEWTGGKSFAAGNLIKILGDSNAIETRIEALLIENQIYDEDFPQEAYDELAYLNDLPANWFKDNSLGRRDLTNECIFTIDPKTARDLDDAVSIKQISEQIYEVGVHIADVSYFVKEMSMVDYHARLRTTSVYLVDRVIPMLPRILCEQMCSLNPGEPKLTFSVIWKMDKYGNIKDIWFGRTVIKSCVKLAYEHAQDIIDSKGDISWINEGVDMPKLHAFDWRTIAKSVLLLNKIAHNMRSRRFQSGALRIDQVKIKFELDKETGSPTGFSFEERTQSNYLIEEFMLLANMSVAQKIYNFRADHAFLRRHPPSPASKLKEVKEFCDARGFELDVSTSGSLQKSLNSITDPTTAKVVSFLLLRSMKNAEYICAGSLPEDDDSYRHFALNVPFYTHFTSPIRRYPDVIVHRQLSLALGLESASLEDIGSLTMMADESTKRKISSKLISTSSQTLYFNAFVQKAGHCELDACITAIHDHSFDVILVDFDRSGRVYLDRLKDTLASFKFQSFAGVRFLELVWKGADQELSKAARRRNRKKEKAKDNASEDQREARDTFVSRSSSNRKERLILNEAQNGRQVINVFDIVKVIVTVDQKDITVLRIDMKPPAM